MWNKNYFSRVIHYNLILQTLASCRCALAAPVRRRCFHTNFYILGLLLPPNSNILLVCSCGPRTKDMQYWDYFFVQTLASQISLSACTIKTLKKRINNYSGTSDRLSKATIRRTEYDYIDTKDVVLAPTTAPVGHVRRVPALPDFPGREMTH